tara:strand:+ start:11537 stop:12766 length:1230 start_codon:yes stop_codon:yes gene_type:complete
MTYILNEGYQNNRKLFDKGKGSKLFIKKKKFIDLSFAAGSLLLGHNSKIFLKAVSSLKKNNLTLMAAPNKQADDYSKLLKKIFPHYSKFIFCSTGTEAVMKSIRISKAITKKDIIIAVTGSWHGSNDKTLFSVNNHFKTIPISSGLSKIDQKNLKFLPYNDLYKSKKILTKYKNKISCILIEPIQASLPNKNVKKYLKFLQNFSKKNNLILIFDELITGLRTDCSSVQSIFKIKPSISTFGKCFGGGMPIGIIGISKKVENKIKKQNPKVFFGGTFSGNSISTFIGKTTVDYIYKNKKKIFKDLELKTNFFKNELIKFINLNNLSVSIYSFKSMLRIVFTKNKIENRIQRDFFEKKNQKKINLFRKFLFSNKIYYSTNGIIFISSQTTLQDIKYILKFLKIGLKKYFQN